MNRFRFFNNIVGYKLMKYIGKDDLQKRIAPRLDGYQSVGKEIPYTGVTFWRKTYLYREYCETKNGYVCQRPAAAGAASDYNGKGLFLLLSCVPLSVILILTFEPS